MPPPFLSSPSTRSHDHRSFAPVTANEKITKKHPALSVPLTLLSHSVQEAAHLYGRFPAQHGHLTTLHLHHLSFGGPLDRGGGGGPTLRGPRARGGGGRKEAVVGHTDPLWGPIGVENRPVDMRGVCFWRSHKLHARPFLDVWDSSEMILGLPQGARSRPKWSGTFFQPRNLLSRLPPQSELGGASASPLNNQYLISKRMKFDQTEHFCQLCSFHRIDQVNLKIIIQWLLETRN